MTKRDGCDVLVDESVTHELPVPPKLARFALTTTASTLASATPLPCSRPPHSTTFTATFQPSLPHLVPTPHLLGRETSPHKPHVF